MPTKISEKKLVVSILCFVAALVIFMKTPVITTPVRISEKGLLLCVVAVGLLVFAIRFFKQSVSKI